MSADETSLNEEQLSRDAREFGLQVAQAAQNEIEGEAGDLRLQTIRSVFSEAVDHIEKRYGPEIAAMWQNEANRVIQQRFAALAPSQESPHCEDAPPTDQEPWSETSLPKEKSRKKR